jgi:hypothetical protein
MVVDGENLQARRVIAYFDPSQLSDIPRPISRTVSVIPSVYAIRMPSSINWNFPASKRASAKNANRHSFSLELKQLTVSR